MGSYSCALSGGLALRPGSANIGRLPERALYGATHTLDRHIDDALAAAIDDDEDWLRSALCAVAHRNDAWLDDDTIEWLTALAHHRHDHDITGTLPLGPAHPGLSEFLCEGRGLSVRG